ncbi:MAG: purine-nucleoside phosphorylase, partial [Endomicrobiales bacterium]
IILGSGMGRLAEGIEEGTAFPFDALPHFSAATVEGHPGNLILGRFAGTPAAVMQGRLHFYEGHTMEEIIFPVRLMRFLGIEHLLVTAAAGGIRPSYRAGDIVFIKDHLNFMGMNCLRGTHDPGFGRRFPDLSQLYPADLRALALTVARENRIRAHEGVYVAVPGPSYETPAEVKAFRKLGGDVVGMSVVPEAVAAHQMGVRVLAISFVGNLACGISETPPAHAEVIETGENVRPKMQKLLEGIVRRLPPAARKDPL